MAGLPDFVENKKMGSDKDKLAYEEFDKYMPDWIREYGNGKTDPLMEDNDENVPAIPYFEGRASWVHVDNIDVFNPGDVVVLSPKKSKIDKVNWARKMFKVSRPCENDRFVGDIARVTDESSPSNGQEVDIDWNLFDESVNKNWKDTDDSVDEFERVIDAEKN